MLKIKPRKGKNEIAKRERLMQQKVKIVMAIYAAIALVLTFSMTAFAAGDPIAVVNNLSDFIFGLIRAVGMILLGFGIVQVGLSLKSHDKAREPMGS